jgi:hypothetical protein
MLHTFVPLLALVLAGGQESKLAIVNPHATYGHLGAARPKGSAPLPGDILYFSFDIKNLKLDAKGRASYSIGIDVFDEKGDLSFQQKPQNAIAQNYFGGNLLSCSSFMEVPLNSKPGPRSWRIVLKDRNSGQSVTAEGKGMVRPADFGLVQVGTFADREGKVPTPPVGVIGSNLYVNFGTVGFGRDTSSKQPNHKVTLRVLDESGKATFPEPLEGHVHQDVPEEMKIIPLQFGLTMNRTGRFTIEISAQDAISGKSDRVTFPVRVLDAE